MNKNKSIMVALIIVTLLSLTSLAMAGQGHGHYGNSQGGCMAAGSCGGGMGYNAAQINQLTPEKQEAYRKIMDSYRAKVEPLRESMWEKRMELRALAPNPNTQPAEIKALVKEIGALHVQMKTERDNLRNGLEKAIGLKLGRGMDGMHHGMRGGHRGMQNGQGMMRGGMMNGTNPNCPYAQ